MWKTLPGLRAVSEDSGRAEKLRGGLTAGTWDRPPTGSQGSARGARRTVEPKVSAVSPIPHAAPWGAHRVGALGAGPVTGHGNGVGNGSTETGHCG